MSNVSKKIYELIIYVLIVVFFTAFIHLGRDYRDASRVVQSISDLRNTDQDTNDRVLKLKQTNSDLFGWITIPDTAIDYPVMHTPDDPEYYLHRNFDGERSNWGTPFLAGECYDGCRNLIIYAHHMQDGTMFADLEHFLDPEFCSTHSRVYLDDGRNQAVYRIWAVCLTDTEDSSFPYYRYFDLTDESRKIEYLNLVREHAVFTTSSGISGSSVLTLSTCSYHTKNGRLVVIAVAD